MWLALSGTAGRHSYIHDDSWDLAHGVDTAGTVAIDELTTPEHGKSGAVRYEPTPSECFTFLVAESRVDSPSEYTLIDLGSGKGRVVLLAGLAGFKRAIGVEFGEELHEVACRNIQAMKARLLPAEVTSVRGDARSYRFPPEPTICFLNNPFSAETLTAVLNIIEMSLQHHPRPFIMIYYHSNHAEVLDGRDGWQAVSKGCWQDESHHFAIYRWNHQ